MSMMRDERKEGDEALQKQVDELKARVGELERERDADLWRDRNGRAV